MSRHQAVRNLDYDEELDDYDAVEDELSAEDRESLARGTQEVRESLGSAAEKVTTQQIHDALWYYYYDIEKTVDYLLKKFIASKPKAEPSAKKPKERKYSLSSYLGSSRSIRGPAESAVADVESLADGIGRRHASSFITMDRYPLPQDQSMGVSLPPSEYFRDMPWLNVPKHLEAVLTAPPPVPGGLLGGGDGPKVSKLQALAAARKKKSEANKKAEEPEERTQKRLSRLSISDQTSGGPPNSGSSSSFVKRQKVSDASTSSRNGPANTVSAQSNIAEQASSTTSRGTEPGSVALGDSIVGRPSKKTYVEGEEEAVASSRQPSAFAQVLCGPSDDSASPVQPDTLPFPYAISTSFNPTAFEEPSPDDIVLAAQAKASNKFDAAAAKNAATAKKASPKAKPVNAPTDEVKSLSLDGPPPKNKKIDVLSEYKKSKDKRSAGFVVVGHVDAGKSTLMGRLLLELKYVEQHLIERYRRQADKIGKSSFALAWVMDQREDEREHGVTIDVATNHFETDRTKFTILDAPGHQDFVSNMIAGATQADFAVLVVDSNTGAFEKGLKGQTREHALLLRSLGVQRVIVAVNKLDKLGWSQDRFDEIAEHITGFMKGNNFPLKKVCFVPMSGLNGDNLVKRSTDERLSWYTGPTLIEALEDSEVQPRALDKPFRLSISEATVSDQGVPTIYGRIDSGTVQTGDALLVQPSGESASVKTIEVDQEPKDWAVAGHNVAIGLYGIDPIHVRHGDMACAKEQPIAVSNRLVLKVLAFDMLFPMPVDVHRGRMHEPGAIREIRALLNKNTGVVEKRNPQSVKAAKVARVVVRLKSPVPLEAGQRIVLRAEGQTVAAGMVE